MEVLKQNLTKFTFFYQHLQLLHDVLQKETGNLEFIQRAHFETIYFININSTKYLFIFGNSCEVIENLNVFLDIDSAKRHHGLSTLYIEQLVSSK